MKTILLALLFIGQTASLLAQQSDAEVTATILHKDSLFWGAYNTCSLQGMRTYLADDVEFYHDKGGMTLGLDSLMASIGKGICRNPDNYQLRREAVEGTVHVYALRKANEVYGAVISGEHVFYIKQAGKDEFIDGHASFTHLWLLRDGVWKMARVLSYDHGPATYVNKRQEITLPDTTLRAHMGKYKGPQTGLVEVAIDGSHLVLLMGANRLPLYAETPDRFFSKERDLTFTFAPGKLVVREHGAVAEELVRQ